MTALSAIGVSKIFEDGFEALSDINLDVAPGEFVTLLGPSGCGKTTLLKICAGFHAPSSGRIELQGTDVTKLPPEARDTAMCFQSYALFPHLSVVENIAFGPKQKRLARAERIQRVEDLLRQVELQEHRGKLPNTLSGGQQQRVALARALAMRPGVVLFDEPLSNLDAKLREQVRYEIRKVQRDFELTVIYVTHDQSEALSLSDRIFVMNKGQVEQSGTPDQIYHRPRTAFVADFIGSANVLEGQITEEATDDRWCVSTAIGDLVVNRTHDPATRTVSLCWRPEDAVLEATGENNISGMVLHRSFQGHFTDLIVDCSGCQQRLQFQRSNIREGDMVSFTIAPDKIVLLESA